MVTFKKLFALSTFCCSISLTYSQNVGIGSTQFTPSSTLEIRSTNNTAGTYGFKLLNSSSSPMMFIQNDGNVGIGTNNPARALDVYGSAVVSSFLGIGTHTPTSALDIYNNNISGTADNIVVTGIRDLPNSCGDLTFQRQRFTGGYLLNGDRIAGIQVFAYNGTNLTSSTLGSRACEINFYADGNHSSGNTPGLISLQAFPSGIMVLNSTGNVGIGTSVPLNKLDVEGGVAIGATYSGLNTAPTNGLLVEGNVGIGTTAPGANLDVAGVGNTAGQSSLQLRSGNNASTFTSSQIVMGYNGGNLYRNAIKTRHNSGAASDNSIDFYVWNFGTDASGTVGTKHVMSIDGYGTGGVGIGTTNPLNKLDVEGAAAIGATYSGSSTAPTNGLIIEGNVGIGTSNPTQKLEIQGVSPSLYMNGSTSNLIQYAINGVAAPSFTTRSAGTKIVLYPRISGTETDYALGIENNTLWQSIPSSSTQFKWYVATTEVMKLQGDGNLGIGSTSPTQKLDVTGNAVFTGNIGIGTTTPTQKLEIQGASPRIYLNGSTSNLIDFGTTGVAVPGAGSAGQKIRLYGSGATAANQYAIGIEDYFMWFSNDATGASTGFKWYGGGTNEVVRFQGNGNVGIGVGGAAVNKLDVEGGAVIGATYSGTNTAPTNGLLVEGNVGIGTTGPTAALHVVGNICYTGTIGACSDARYKTNFKQIPNALESVMQINGLKYNWKVSEFPEKKFTTDTQIGFIAQDIEKIYPELVLTDAKGYKSVDYSRLTPILVEAIKEQQIKIDNQQKIIEELKAENKKTSTDVSLIKSQLNTLMQVTGKLK